MSFKDWFLARAKAFAAVAAAPIAGAIIKGVEAAVGVDIPTELEITIIGLVTGGIVYRVPNKVV